MLNGTDLFLYTLRLTEHPQKLSRKRNEDDAVPQFENKLLRLLYD